MLQSEVFIYDKPIVYQIFQKACYINRSVMTKKENGMALCFFFFFWWLVNVTGSTLCHVKIKKENVVSESAIKSRMAGRVNWLIVWSPHLI